MSTLNITIGLILITLASTTVSVFWKGTLRRKLLLLVLAGCSSIGAIYEAHEMERRAAAISGKLQSLILTGDSVPYGFEDALLRAANQIAIQENYSQAMLQKTASEWNSEHFGYGIAFYEPSAERPLTGYEEISMRSGYAHAFVYVSKSAIRDLVETFHKGSDLKAVLDEHTLWVWESADITDERFLQSIQGIAYLAYSTATNSQYNREFQSNPEKFWIDLDIEEKERITVSARRRDVDGGLRGSRYVLDFMPWSDLEELAGKDAITRGGMIPDCCINVRQIDVKRRRSVLREPAGVLFRAFRCCSWRGPICRRGESCARRVG